ncbi:MAG: ArsR/SmtB family transcription factor [Candidatus Heimdallarchaeota archaeon]
MYSNVKPNSALIQTFQRMIEAKVCPIDNLDEYCSTFLEDVRKIQDSNERERTRVLTKQLKAIANERRLQILLLLSRQSRCLCELEFALDLAQPTISYHVKALEGVGLIQSEKRGKWTFFSLSESEPLQTFWQLLCRDAK